jgi:ADP-ribosylglycohydrolase
MKKAWELEYEVFSNAQPVILSDEEQTWDAASEFENLSNIKYRMKWNSNVPGSGAPEKVIVGAVQSMENMGYDVTEAEKLMHRGLKAYEEEDLLSLIKITNELWNVFGKLPKIKDHKYHQYALYDNYEKYLSSVVFPKKKQVDVNSKVFFDAVYNGWLAQFVGGAFGTAMEGYTYENLFKSFGEIRDYIRKPNTYNDDVTYELAFLEAFSKQGYRVTSKDIALEWVALVPFGWSAEEIALKNIEAGILPPESGYFNNPFREWIGAQMRGAVCGMVAPGDLKLAAELAFKDGVVSHHNNGVLGEVFNAVMVSMAFIENDVRVILDECINLIPSDSEYYTIIEKAYSACKKYDTWKQAWNELEPIFKKYNWIHAYPNAAAEVVALWFGNGDFNETLHIVGMMGYDVDCNAAQIMTIIGIIDKRIPSKWTDPIGDEINTYCRKYKKTSFTELTQLTINSINNAG